MSLIRQTSLSPLTRLLLAVALVCALLITQWRLNDHVVEHSAKTLSVSASVAVTNDSSTHDGPGCLLCLEHQAHGAALTSTITLALALMVSVLMAKALPHNAPYLTPERARQRAPPAFS
jgi:hypothetical protein